MGICKSAPCKLSFLFMFGNSASINVCLVISPARIAGRPAGRAYNTLNPEPDTSYPELSVHPDTHSSMLMTASVCTCLHGHLFPRSTLKPATPHPTSCYSQQCVDDRLAVCEGQQVVADAAQPHATAVGRPAHKTTQQCTCHLAVQYNKQYIQYMQYSTTGSATGNC